MEYQYKHGDRPLEGYTIQQAVGRGGFGEVYYALSDGGREVALKAIQGYEEIELRGISQCMNLKNPHLVTIFDVKRNDQGRAFVIMEYVAGPSLRELIDQAPGGLGVQKSAFFLREIAKGLTFLHDRGIVHRDLKPGNIFFEDGCVKIGDYGLSKAISPSQHSGHTITVGTVHYMAPEIGAGIYDAKIDIYALGALLYEMLTGQPPYLGASVGEILMKHLANEPDVSGIEEPFASAIKKAMAKNPLDRYGSAQEVVEAVFGAEHVRNSVSCFSPGGLSMVAARAGQKVRMGPSGSSAGANGNAYGPRPQAGSDFWTRLDQSTDRVANRIGEFVDRVKGPGQDPQASGQPPEASEPKPVADPLTSAQRKKLAVVVMAAMALGCGLIAPFRDGFYIGPLGTFTMTFGTCFGIWLVRRKLWPQSPPPSPALGRLLVTALACVFGICISAGFWAGVGFDRPAFVGTWLAIGAGLAIRDWWRATFPGRYERVSLGFAIGTAAVGLVVALMTHGFPMVTMAVLAGTCLVTQLVSPFDTATPRPPRHSSVVNGDVHLGPNDPVPDVVNGNIWLNEGQPLPRVVNGNIFVNGQPLPRTASGNTVVRSPVPATVRVLFVVGLIALLTLGAMLFISLGFVRYQPEEEVLVLGGGIGSCLFAVFCLVKACSTTYRHWWSSFVKPVLLILCILTASGAGLCLGVLHLHNDEALAAIFFLVFPAVLFIVLATLPNRIFQRAGRSVRTSSSTTELPSMVSPYKRLWALLLAAGIFVGFGGLHRFYVGKVGTGIVWLLTGGLLGVGQLIDAIMIIAGQFRDAEGRRLVTWENEEANPPAPAAPIPPNPPVTPPVSASAAWVKPPRQSNPWLSLLAGLLVTLSIAVGTVFLIGIKASRVAVDPATAEGYQRTFGTAEWPEMLHDGGMMVIVILNMAAGALLIVGRRRAGAKHMIRAGIGIGGVILSIFMFDQSIRIVPRIAGGMFGPESVRLLFDETPLVFTAFVFLLSILILAWPERRAGVPVVPPVSEGVAQ